jgi:hypothetical protein
MNGEAVVVLVSRNRLSPEKTSWLDDLRAQAVRAARHVDLKDAKAPRVSLFGSDADGNRLVWDLAVYPTDLDGYPLNDATK